MDEKLSQEQRDEFYVFVEKLRGEHHRIPTNDDIERMLKAVVNRYENTSAAIQIFMELLAAYPKYEPLEPFNLADLEELGCHENVKAALAKVKEVMGNATSPPPRSARPPARRT